jgi:hypothetical protein
MSRASVIILSNARLSTARSALWKAEESLRHGKDKEAKQEAAQALYEIERAAAQIKKAFRIEAPE